MPRSVTNPCSNFADFEASTPATTHCAVGDFDPLGSEIVKLSQHQQRRPSTSSLI